MAPDWPRCSQARARHTKQARMLRQPGLPCSTKWIDDALILLVRECHEMAVQWRMRAPKITASPLGSFVPVNAPARHPRDRQRRGVPEGFGTATDRVARRSKSRL